jgi:glycosyltransferase involved in cell wall biosynthesis
MQAANDTVQPRIAVFVSFSGAGGVERVTANLLQGFIDRGVAVDLLLVKAQGMHMESIPDAVNRVPLGVSHTFGALLPLVRYLRRARPAALLVAKHRAIVVALLARRLAGVATPVIGQFHTTLSAALADRSAWTRALWTRSMRLFYPWADRIVGVSRGVVDDVATMAALPRERLAVIPNPVVSDALFARARAELDHPWLAEDSAVPVIIGSGRFTRQKDFPTLIRAFARLHSERPARLLILGDGADRDDCWRLVEQLGLARDVQFTGLVQNPYAYLARAQLFVLSSRWEGSPTVLTEALALGIPVVSTDCPSGPREILDQGRLAPLVPVEDVEAMARAMAQVLDHPPAAETLRAATQDYTVSHSAQVYLSLMGIGPREPV